MKANPTTLPGLLLSIALLAACSEHSATTAPSADAVGLSPAGLIGDRPYTWQVDCFSHDQPFGTIGLDVGWVWLSSGTRPAAADGFSACVNYLCQSWTFDPTGPFKTHLKGTASIIQFFQPGCDPFGHIHQYCYLTATATLTVDS